MDYETLENPWRRSIGAMFRRRLGQTALVFEYAHTASRLFHTVFCRTLRLVAFSDDGDIVFDRVVQPWRLVRIPATRIVVELDPTTVFDEQALWESIQVRDAVPQTAVGSWHPEATIDRLFFALIAEAVADIRRVYEAINRARTLSPEVLPSRFTPWERGQILGSAALVLEGAGSIDIPENAILISRQVIEAERQSGYWEELMAASIAGGSWRFPRVCFKCEAVANWRPVLTRPAAMPEETAWRYERPENCVPVCRRCVYLLNWKTLAVRRELAYMLWGARFEAFEAWHLAWQRFQGDSCWDLERYPLWPATCGGMTWAQGSGALQHVSPEHPREVFRQPEHKILLEKYFQRKQPTRHFWASPLQKQVDYEPAYTV